MKFFETHEPDSTAYVRSAPVQAKGNVWSVFVNVPIRSTTDLDQIRAAFIKQLREKEYGEFVCALTVLRSESDQILRPGFSFDFRVFAWGDEEDEGEDLESELDDDEDDEEGEEGEE